jgi:hypothetical protein
MAVLYCRYHQKHPVYDELRSLAHICDRPNTGKSRDSRSFVRFIGRAIRITTVLAAIGGASLLLWWGAAAPAADAWRGLHGWTPRAGWSLDLLVTDTLACVAIVVGLGLAGVTTLTVLSALLATARPSLGLLLPTCAPRRWRRFVLAACGLAVTAPAFAAPSLAADLSPPACTAGCPAPVIGLELPDLPLSTFGDRTPTPPHHDVKPSTRTVKVRRDDSLWTIAASAAAPEATNATIAHDVAMLYAHNRTVIGSDPDLIYPGTTLSLPGEES